MVFDGTFKNEFQTMSTDDFKELQSALECNENISEMAIFQKFLQCIEKLKIFLSSKSRKARLWLQYMDNIDVM